MQLIKSTLALAFGMLLGVLQVKRFPHLPVPDNAVAVGYDLFWMSSMIGAIYLVVYGGSAIRASPKTREFRF